MEGVPPKVMQVHELSPANTPQLIMRQSNAGGNLDPNMPPASVNSRTFPTGRCRYLTKDIADETVGRVACVLATCVSIL